MNHSDSERPQSKSMTSADLTTCYNCTALVNVFTLQDWYHYLWSHDLNWTFRWLMPLATGTRFAGLNRSCTTKLSCEKNSLNSYSKWNQLINFGCFTSLLKCMTFTDKILYKNSIRLSPTISSVNSNFWPLALHYVIHVFFFTFTASNCGQHWHAYKSGCLRLFQDHKAWVAAKDHCANFSTPGKGNGRLISIFSQAENNRIVNLWSLQGFAEGVVSRNYYHY